MTKTAPDMKLRISAALRRQIEEAAKRNNRTMNGEIVSRLEKSFLSVGEREPVEHQLHDHEKRIHDLEDLASELNDRVWELSGTKSDKRTKG
ncbi:Arc family DNA-binding protein [Mesorhizobium sp. NZP2077]|uniref:Arc family DNA-binding protein n=1 Tax=Mesorhizobium sp. NZP2077 TaxID=2483404 RepID=UPI0015570A1D|nr:Arc family DNA-binding protein [Mesorhizobium sp. NZP2077]QKC85763.1 Arc family DNA-binding protein [Mesorhizobium sp. NZP2077]QKD19402.1 Arc family DNA-binding protein [Mesorhizobium sp. NZP2077]